MTEGAVATLKRKSAVLLVALIFSAVITELALPFSMLSALGPLAEFFFDHPVALLIVILIPVALFAMAFVDDLFASR